MISAIEFAFLFVAWRLYLVHAVLTGTSFAVVIALGVRDGFSFSAGLIDDALNWGTATRPLWLVPIGVTSFMLDRQPCSPGPRQPHPWR
jgi:PTS system N-acetylglucosamine-specific IIC component